MKPIESGCLAVIVDPEVPENHGKVVRVLDCAGPPGTRFFDPAGGSVWRVSEPLVYVGVSEETGKPVLLGSDPYAPEKSLQRLDEKDTPAVPQPEAATA